MPHLISYVKNRISYDKSGDRELYTVSGVGHLASVSRGIGLLYFWIHMGENPVLSSQFVLLKSAPAGYTRVNDDQASLCFEPPARFPCSGFIAGSGEGYIFANALRLSITLGSDIILLLLSPAKAAFQVSLEKTSLSALGEEATVILSSESGEVHCAGNVTGKFKAAKIILNRNPGLPVYSHGFNETLSELKEPGNIRCLWKPVTRDFEEQLLVFHPNVTSSYHLGPPTGYEIPIDLRRIIGVFDEETDYVLGDGEGVDYTIRLVIDRGLGRHSSDETRLIVK